MDKSNVLIGRGRICDFLSIGKEAFYTLVKNGMPVRKVGAMWVGHQDDLEEFFRCHPVKKKASRKR